MANAIAAVDDGVIVVVVVVGLYIGTVGGGVGGGDDGWFTFYVPVIA